MSNAVGSTATGTMSSAHIHSIQLIPLFLYSALAVLSFVPLPILSLCLTSRASPTEWRSVHAVFVLCYLVIDEAIFGFGFTSTVRVG